MIRRLLILLLLLAVAAPGAAQVAVAPGAPAMLEKVTALSLRETGGTLFENVASILAARYVDKEFRSKELPALVDRYREQAKAASSLAEERAVVQQMLSHVPASHLGLLSKTGHRQIIDGLVIDVRGRGGSATEVPRIIEIVREYRASTGRPVVALIDRQSRSGKDILAWEFKQMGVRLVGEATAGAVIPATFADVGYDSVLMFPTFRLQKYTDLLEFKPVPPDVPAPRPTLYAAGRDEILDAGVTEAFRLIGRR